MAPEDIQSLSTSSRVLQLVENEKVARQRARRANEEEEMFREQTREADRESMQQEVEGEHAEQDEHEHLYPGSSSSPSLRPPSTNTSYTDRNGSCVVCQDDEANIVIGYVAFYSVLWTFLV
jgi:hypothetical protein